MCLTFLFRSSLLTAWRLRRLWTLFGFISCGQLRFGYSSWTLNLNSAIFRLLVPADEGTTGLEFSQFLTFVLILLVSNAISAVFDWSAWEPVIWYSLFSCIFSCIWCNAVILLPLSTHLLLDRREVYFFGVYIKAQPFGLVNKLVMRGSHHWKLLKSLSIVDSFSILSISVLWAKVLQSEFGWLLGACCLGPLGWDNVNDARERMWIYSWPCEPWQCLPIASFSWILFYNSNVGCGMLHARVGSLLIICEKWTTVSLLLGPSSVSFVAEMHGIAHLEGKARILATVRMLLDRVRHAYSSIWFQIAIGSIM